MADVTQVLARIESGDPTAAEELLPFVYDELRKLAAQWLAQEKPGQTLQATALVHEAYLRLVGPRSRQHWDNRGHFFSAAAEAMRRILVENARRKGRQKRAGDRKHVDLDEADLVTLVGPEELLAVDDALGELAREDAPAAELVKLRYYAGLSVEEAGQVLGMSRATAYRQWTYARAWLRCRLTRQPPESSG